jgi:hypothetical protein
MSLFKKLSEIATSWYDFKEATDYTKQLMEHRLSICDSCTEKQQLNSLGKLLVTSVNEDASLFKCGKCNCPLSPKTAGLLNTCPLGKWGIAGTELK